MSLLLCHLGYHDVHGTPVKRDGRAYWKCQRCHGLSKPIDLPVLDEPAPPVVRREPRSRMWWLRGVFEGERRAGL